MRNLIKRNTIYTLSLLAFFALFATLSRAQDLASITGLVTDASGMPLSL